MNDGYPSYTKSAQQGESGVNLIAQIVNDHFGWIFKRNHQEYDFGIDGQIEVITSTGAVTGQMVAVQIKYGTSFFKEKNLSPNVIICVHTLSPFFSLSFLFFHEFQVQNLYQIQRQK